MIKIDKKQYEKFVVQGWKPYTKEVRDNISLISFESHGIYVYFKQGDSTI